MEAVVRADKLRERLASLTKPVSELEEGMLISATYDGDLRVAVLKFYEPKTGQMRLWRDNTGHKPYCYTKLERQELEVVGRRNDVLRIEETEKADLLSDSMIKVRKIVATDPLAIGGGQNSVRDQIRAWEADIKYFENYAYDNGLRMGTYYRISGGKVLPLKLDAPELVTKSLEEIFRRNPPEFGPYLREWAELLGQPLPDFKRIALDIEVANEENRVPDPDAADLPVIAVSFFNEYEKVVYLLERENRETVELSNAEYKTVLFHDEQTLLRATLSKMMEYPVVVTFNGDDFDLRYLKHRAERREISIREEENPITLERVAATLKHGIHIDLYQFFRNRSIQVYAFSNKYTEHTLNGIAEILLGKSKIEFEGNVGDLPLSELANYCFNDARLAYELTSMSGSVVMKLLVVLARIGKMPMNDVSRLGVSNWIRSMLFYEHRKINALIPRQDELSEKGGASSQAIIKGKKYKGGLVIEPKPGVYFDVSVLDFASLIYDESIFVRMRQSGKVYRTKIGEFVEQRLPPGEDFAAKEVGPTWDVLSFDYGRQRASWKTVTTVIRHPTQTDVLEVVTESGRRVRITKGHSLISLDSSGKKKTVRGKDLNVGDYLVVLSSFSADQQDVALDLLPYLQKLSDYDITRGAGGHGRTAILKSRRSHRRFVLERYLPLTSDLMWGLGYWVAEGWLGGDKYGESLQMEAASKDIEIARSKFDKAGFGAWSSESKTPGCSNLGINGRYEHGVCVLPATIFAKLVKIWFGDHSPKKRIPDWVLQLPLQTRNAFMQGYYKGDGFNSTDYAQFVTNGRYKVGSYSQLLVSDMMSLGLMSGLHCFSKALNSRESYLTWSDGAESYLDTKRPPPELLVRSEHVQSFAKTAFYSHRREPVRYERVNRTSVNEYKQELENFYGGNCHFEKVKRITAVENSSPVYDISVKGSESFFNTDGILVSNSLYPSLIKVHNLSYETVNCPHEECRKNIVPETTHWVCTRRKGVTSLVTGSLRDLRVSHYKPLSKVPTLGKDEGDLYGIVSQGLKVILNACFSGDTELVTPEGIKNIKDFKVGDRVVSVNPESLEPEIDEVVDVQAFDYNGDMYHFKDKRFVDLLVTPNHRFLTIDRRGGSRTGVVFRSAEEIYKGTNMTIPKLRSPPISGASSRISMLKTARALHADVHLYPNGRRLSSWFRTLEPGLRSKIRAFGTVHKQKSKVNKSWGSHYSLPSSEISEEDLDEVERNGGFALVSEKRSSKIPVRFDGDRFAALCGWFVSEGSLYSTAPREYPTGAKRGRSEGVVVSQSYGRGNPRGLVYRGKIAGLLSSLRLRGRTDSEEQEYFKVASGILHEWTRSNCYSEGVGSHRASAKCIPRFVFASVETMRAFLESAYMGDGSAKQVCYSTTSESLAKDMVVLLSLLGGKSKIKWDNGVYRLTFKNVSSKLTHSGGRIHKHVTRFPFEGKVYCVTTAKNHTVTAGRNGRFVQVGQSYGVMGFETFAFYCLPVAEATAALGRYAITKTIEKCGELGISVIYGDTDSIFLQSPSKEQVMTVTLWAEKELGVELDLDKNYRYIAFSSRKKNYFGVLPDGTPDIKGLTGKKSQTPEFLKKTFYDALEILGRVQTSADFERARGSIRELLTTMILRLRNRSIPIEELAFNVMIGKPTRGYNENTPQHVKAAQLLEKTGREIKAGDIISYVKTRTPPFVKPVSLAKADEIDEEKYIEYAHSMFDQMLDALDFSFDEIMGATTLDLFWS